MPQTTRRYGGWPSPLADAELLERAKAWLLAGETVADVAGRCGYSSRAAFTNAFREQTGATPGAWVKVQLGGRASAS